MRAVRFLFFIIVFLSAATGSGSDRAGVASSSFAFIDSQYIWTLEIVPDPYDRVVPILNIVTLDRGEWDFRPVQVTLVNPEGRIAEVERFSISTGVEGEPYLTNYLKIHGNSFIGFDLVGDFEDFRTLTEVSIEMGDNLFRLEPLLPSVFESLVTKIDQINVDSPDIREDFRVLGIRFMGSRERADTRY